MRRHSYEVAVTWLGGSAGGPSPAHSRDHVVDADGRATIDASADPAFRGDPARWNPEQLYVASIAQCHMLWYLHLAAAAGITVVAYEDRPTGVMVEEAGGAGRFESVTLHPVVTIGSGGDMQVAEELHHRVGDYCFIARSVNTPIDHDVTIRTSVAG